MDVYAFGVMMWELITRKDYFGGEKFMFKVEKQLINGERKPIPEDCDPTYAKLLEKCWGDRASSRPTFPECVSILLDLKEKLKLDSINVQHALQFRLPFCSTLLDLPLPSQWSLGDLPSSVWNVSNLQHISSLDGHQIGNKYLSF